MRKKSKELLEGLGNIIRKPSAFAEQKFKSYTNRFYTVQNLIHKLPAKYDKAKKQKDEEGEEYIYIDRVYGGMYGQTLHQANGTQYKGKLYNKRRLVTHKGFNSEQNNFYSKCTVTADGRWFDNCGMPIETPTKLEPEKVKTEEEIEEEKQQKAEIAKAKEAAILANLK
jgi:hypothetical protein